MDKVTSVIAALDAGKLPSTQQMNQLIDWVISVGLTKAEPADTGGLSSQGRFLADDLRNVLEAHKKLGVHKNDDNILQEAIWHLTEGDIDSTSTDLMDIDEANADINAIRSALRALVSVLWTNLSSEGTYLFHDFLSFARLALADAAGLVETQAGHAKESLREIEKEVQEGERDSAGRSKKRLREEEDIKVQFEHGMDTLKDTGSSVIGAGQSVTASAQDSVDKSSSRLQDTFYKICDRAQSDSNYSTALNTIFSIIQKRLDKTLATARDSDLTLSSFIHDPTPEQHIPKALGFLRTLLERLSGSQSLDELLASFRRCAFSVLHNPTLKMWFNDFLTNAQKNLSEPGYARSDDSREKRKELKKRWKALLEDDAEWKQKWDEFKVQLKKFEKGIEEDKDLVKLKAAHVKLGKDIETGLVEAGSEVGQTGLQAALEQALWFWQDIFKVYLPRMLSILKDIPIPRTEYKDNEIELVLENLDVSSFNFLPSHVYIRNITDIDVNASATAASRTAIGTLTHIRIQAIQLTLKDISFYYKDKTASTLAPSEHTGLLALNLPQKGIDLDLKIRLIPSTVTGVQSREALKRYTVIESLNVGISDDIGLEVKESNHAVLLSVFKPIFMIRLRDALEKTLAEEIRVGLDWVDEILWDVGRRRGVFEDMGVGKGAAVTAAVWSEVGRLRRIGKEEGGEMGVKATGTGLVVEQKGKDGKKVAMLAMGMEPQILSGEKRGPLGTASEPIGKRLEQVTGIDINGARDATGDVTRELERTSEHVKEQARGLVREGQRQAKSFKRSVDAKKEEEQQREGWESSAFDLL